MPRKIILIFACILWVPILQARAAAPSSRPVELLKAEAVFRDPHSSEDDAMGAIAAIRKIPAQYETKDFWRDIVHNSSYSNTRRGLAIIQIIDRHILPGMSVPRIGTMLAADSWLQQERMVYWPKSYAGDLGVDLFVAGQIMPISMPMDFRKSVFAYFIFSFDGRPDPADLYSSLIGKVSSADQITAMQVAVSSRDRPSIPADRALYYKEIALFNRKSFPNHWIPNPPRMDATMAEMASIFKANLDAGNANIRSGAVKEGEHDNFADSFQLEANRMILAMEYDVGRGLHDPDEVFIGQLKYYASLVGDYQTTISGEWDKAFGSPGAKQCSEKFTSLAKQILATAGGMNQEERDDYEMSLDQLFMRSP